MRYVTDLLSVKPEEIQHVCGDEVIAVYPRVDVFHPWFVVCKNSDGNHWGSVFGRALNVFVYKPKTKRVLKPLHVVLAENPGYMIDVDGNFIVGGVDIYNFQLEHFRGNTVGQGWPEDFYTEVEDEVP